MTGRKLAELEAHWPRCLGDTRLQSTKHFRDKYTAHLGEPKSISPANYTDLFSFGAAAVQAVEPVGHCPRGGTQDHAHMFAVAIGAAAESVNYDPDLVASPEAFWKPWR